MYRKVESKVAGMETKNIQFCLFNDVAMILLSFLISNT